jgi:hypothetical protein
MEELKQKKFIETKFTKHALERMQERQINRNDVIRVLRKPTKRKRSLITNHISAIDEAGIIIVYRKYKLSRVVVTVMKRGEVGFPINTIANIRG